MIDDLNSHALADTLLDHATPDVAEPSMVTPAAKAPVNNAFADMGLAPELLAALKDLNFTQPTTVQTKAIPLALQDDASKPSIDLLVSSQTGSGKTAAFLLPVLHTLLVERQAQETAEAQEWGQKVAEARAKGEELPKKARTNASASCCSCCLSLNHRAPLTAK